MGVRRILIGMSVIACLALPASAAAVTLAPGDLLVANYENDTPGSEFGVVKVHPLTGKQTLVSSNDQPVNAGTTELFTGAWDLLILPNGELVVTDQSNAVIGVNPVTGKQRIISSNTQPVNSSNPLLSFPTGIVRLPDGDLAVSNNPPNGVVRIDPATGQQSVLSSNDQPVNVGTAYFSGPYDLTTGRGGSLVVSDTGAYGDGGLISVNPATGKQTKLASNDQPINSASQLFDEPASAQLHRGFFYVSQGSAGDPGVAGVVKVDAATGKQTLVSSNAQPVNTSSAYFVYGYGIAVEPGGRVIVADENADGGQGGLISVNPLTGKQSILSFNSEPPNLGSSELLNYVNGVMVVPPKCGGLYPTMVGTSGKDKITGTPFPDIIAGLGGGDTLKGLGAADRLCGGPGPDLLIGGKGRDRLIGAKGRDRLRGGPGRDILRGGPGRDRQRQ